MKTTHIAAIITITLGASLQAEPVYKLMPSVLETTNKLDFAVAVHGDHILAGGGNAALYVGDLMSPGCAYVWAWSGAAWVEQARLVSAVTTNTGGYYGTNSGWFGKALALGGDYAAVGAPEEFGQAGRVYVFQRSGTNWSLAATLQPDKVVPEPAYQPMFGASVAADGEVIAVGAPQDNNFFGTDSGAVYVFRRSGGVWVKEAKLTGAATDPANYYFGEQVALQGEYLAVTGNYIVRPNVDYRPAVYVFRYLGGTWQLRTRLSPGEYCDTTASSVAITTNTVVLGCQAATNAVGFHSGAAYVFEKPVGGWAAFPTQTETAKLVPAGVQGMPNYFGRSVALDGDVLAIGEPDRILPSLPTAGQVSVYRRIDGVWSLHSELWPPGFSELDYGEKLGYGVALKSGRLAVLAPFGRLPWGFVAYGAVCVYRPLAPAMPYGPTPTDGQSIANTNTSLTWTNGSATATIDLYCNPAGYYASNQVVTNLVLNNVPPVGTYAAPIQANRHYCWQVIARNAFGETDGPIWDFTTVGPLDFELSTTNLAFGGQLTNTTSAIRTLSIFNPGRNSISLDISLTNRAFWIARQGYGSPTGYVAHLNYQIPVWQASTLEIVFAPTTAGAIADVLTLRTVSGSYAFTNQVLLTGTGLSSVAGAPANPNPPSGATDQSADTDPHWQNGTGTTAVDLLFSRSGQPLAYLLSNAAPVTTYALPRLLYDTTYQWQVICRGGGGSTPGPVWTFTTGHPRIEVIAPNGREGWRVGTPHTIEWLAKEGTATVQLDLCVLDPNGRLRRVSVLATNVPADAGSYAWNIDPHLEPGDGYYIRVRDEWDLSYYDQSDGPFALTPTIHVVYPNGGEQVRAGAPCNITWLGEGLGGDVSLDILQDGSGYERLGRVPNTGSYVWAVPCDHAAKRLQARVAWVSDESLNDLSDGMFDVVVLPPDKASNPSPADRAEDVSRTPTLTWTNGAGTCEVEVWFGLANPPDELAYSGVLTNSFPVSHALRAEAVHYWRVVSLNRAGSTNGPVWRFTTMMAIQAPRLTAPTRNGNQMQFQWTPYQAGVQYRLQSTTNLSLAFTDVAVVQTNRYTHTNGAAATVRFYRALAEPAP